MKSFRLEVELTTSDERTGEIDLNNLRIVIYNQADGEYTLGLLDFNPSAKTIMDVFAGDMDDVRQYFIFGWEDYDQFIVNGVKCKPLKLMDTIQAEFNRLKAEASI